MSSCGSRRSTASTRATQRDIRDFTDVAGAHKLILDAPLHRFRYKRDVEGYGEASPLAKERVGFIADEVDPAFMWGDSIDQVSVNGLIMASSKQLQHEIDTLAAENQQLRADRAHLESRLDAMDKRLAALDGGPVRTARHAGPPIGWTLGLLAVAGAVVFGRRRG